MKSLSREQGGKTKICDALLRKKAIYPSCRKKSIISSVIYWKLRARECDKQFFFRPHGFISAGGELRLPIIRVVRDEQRRLGSDQKWKNPQNPQQDLEVLYGTGLPRIVF